MAFAIQKYSLEFPILSSTPSPKNQVELLETIGKGNYGYVYKGRFLKNSLITAVKVVYLKEDEIKETLLEMQILQSCNHINITKFMGCYLKGLDFWICMEFCGGGSLDSIYRLFKKPLSEEQIAVILLETLNALHYLHTHVGLIHRDIKAGNLLLTDQGHLKLADFGVSAQLDHPGGAAKTFIGTPYWMAPEVIGMDPETNNDENATYTDKADIWSLGITAIEIAEKNPPLSDIHPMRALFLIPKSQIGFSKPKIWSKVFLDFVSCCLVKDPNKRPSASQMLQHPFIQKAKELPANDILQALVNKSKIAKEKKKLGIEFDEDEDTPLSESISQKIINETVKRTKPLVSLPQQIRTHSQDNLSTSSEQSVPDINNEILSAEASVEICCIAENIKLDVLSSDILDGQYIIIGGERALYFVDLKSNTKMPHVLIKDTKFSQIQILEDYSVLVALSGKHDHVRQYKLSSIRKLIRFILGDSVSKLSKLDLSFLPATDDISDQDGYYSKLETQNVKDDEMYLRAWTHDYIKIPATRDSKQFVIQRTLNSVFLVILVKQELVLLQWASEPYSKFLKLMAFWLPENPKFFQLIHDGVSIKEICLGYSREATMVLTEDSKVVDISIHTQFKTTSKSWKPRWRTFSQIPFSPKKEEEIRALTSNAPTVNRKLTAATSPSINQNQTKATRYFLSTFDTTTFVTNIDGAPMSGAGAGGWKDGVVWSSPPNTLILRAIDYVIGVGNNFLHIYDWKTAICRQKIDFSSSVNLRVLSDRPGGILLWAEIKRRPPAMYWIKEKIETCIYERKIPTATKLLSPLMEKLHLDEANGLNHESGSLRAVNDISSSRESNASSRGGTPPISSADFIRMRNQQVNSISGSALSIRSESEMLKRPLSNPSSLYNISNASLGNYLDSISNSSSNSKILPVNNQKPIEMNPFISLNPSPAISNPYALPSHISLDDRTEKRALLINTNPVVDSQRQSIHIFNPPSASIYLPTTETMLNNDPTLVRRLSPEINQNITPTYSYQPQFNIIPPQRQFISPSPSKIQQSINQTEITTSKAPSIPLPITPDAAPKLMPPPRNIESLSAVVYSDEEL